MDIPAFGVRARILDEDFEPLVGLGGQQGPQPRMSAIDLSPWVPLGFDHGVRSVSVPDSVRDELVTPVARRGVRSRHIFTSMAGPMRRCRRQREGRQL